MHLVERAAKEGKPLQKKSKLETPLPFGLLGRSSVPTSSKVNGNSSNPQSAKPNGKSHASSAKVDYALSIGHSDKPRTVPPLPRHSNASEGVAGPSKRPSSPLVPPESSKVKKVKNVGALGCPVCDGMIHHLVKDCPEVKAGPKRCETYSIRDASAVSDESIEG